MMICLIILCFWLHQRLMPNHQFERPRAKLSTDTFTYTHPRCRNAKKPPWVTEKVLYLKAITGLAVVKWLKRLITLSDKQKAILGIVEYGSRLCLKLETLPSSNAFQTMLSLTSTIRQYGFPKYIRTDNGRSFIAKSTTLALSLLGIKHQRTNIASPWQNGRIERFFGTFKPLAKLADLSEQNLPSRLAIFTAWYNCVRTHENLNGRTPKEAWIGKLDNKTKQPILVSDWDGLLTGYYLPD